MIQQSSFAASVKEDKPILTGELFESGDNMFYVVAMDRYRLALRQEQLAELGTFRFVVPKKALSELIMLLKDEEDAMCEFSTNGKHIVFSVNGFELFARLLEGQFHNFRSSIPNEEKTVVVMNTRDMIGCAERCALLINEKNKAPETSAPLNKRKGIAMPIAAKAVTDAQIDGNLSLLKRSETEYDANTSPRAGYESNANTKAAQKSTASPPKRS
jgi:DNA polymerase-3 subunit beta